MDLLDKHQKKVLRFSIEQFLGELTADRFERATKAIKSLPDKARDLWHQYGGPVAGVINVILKKLNLEAVDLDPAFQRDMVKEESLRFHLEQLAAIAQELRFLSTYVLVDRVDEIELTATDAAATFQFMRPLLVDLPTLELNGLALKFFLWDAILDDYLANGARRDRVPIYQLSWSPEDLKKTMSERLKAYSAGRCSSLSELMCDRVDLDIDTLAAHLAAGSPRDMIRLMDRVVAEQTRVSADYDCVSEVAFWAGVRGFSDVRATELFPRYLPDLRRIGASGKVTFTVNHLASDVFRVEQQSARNKVQNWMKTGLVDRIDEVPNPPNRPMYLYGAVDVRLAIAMLTDFSPAEVLSTCVFVCPSCRGIAISDAQSMACRQCGHRFEIAKPKVSFRVAQFPRRGGPRKRTRL